MVAQFGLSSEGGREIERKLAGLVEAFGDLEPLMAKLGIYLESATIERFETQTAPDGRKWEPSERAKRDNGKTLVDTSQLRSSITHSASSRSVEVGTNKIYAGVHQYGMNETVSVSAHSRTSPGGLTFAVDAFDRMMNTPARPFLGLSVEDETELNFLVDQHFRDVLNQP